MPPYLRLGEAAQVRSSLKGTIPLDDPFERLGQWKMWLPARGRISPWKRPA